MKLITNETYDEILAHADTVRDAINPIFNRKRDRAYYSTVLNGLRDATGYGSTEPEQLRPNDVVVYSRLYNLGTRTYPDFIRTHETMPVHCAEKKPGSLMGRKFRIRYDEIIAVIREEESE